jgi:hypothetical protein
MANRFAHVQKLVQIRRDIQAFPDNADRILFTAIVRALPKQYHQVYDWIGACYQPVTSGAVAKAWDLKQNHASTLLKELHDFGLLKRTERIDEGGRTFLYEQA